MKYHELAEKKPVNLDALPENADWTKRTWDLGGPREIEYVLYNIIAGGWGPDKQKEPGFVQQRLDLFMKSPAGRGMPAAHRARLRRLGWRVE